MTEEYDKAFGDLVREIRESKKISKRQLELELGLSRMALSRIENGDHSVSLSRALKLAKFLGVSIDSLISDTNEKVEEFLSKNYSEEKSQIQEAMKIFKLIEK